jgi:hypothetical protein
MATTDTTNAPMAEDKGLHQSTGNQGLNGDHGVQHRGQNNWNNPLAHAHSGTDARLPAFGGEFQPGLYKSIETRKFANPAPLGLSAFALTTFVLSLINLNARNVGVPNIVASLAFGYGGLVQLLAGMW